MLGDELSEKPSCNQIFNKLAEYQNDKQERIGKILKNFKVTKEHFQKNKDQFRSEFLTFFGDFNFAKNKVLQSLNLNKNLLKSYKNDFDLVKQSNSSDIQEIKAELFDLANNKLNFAYKIKNFANQILEFQSDNKKYKKNISNDLQIILKSMNEYKTLILNKIVPVYKNSQILKQQQIQTKNSVKIEIQELTQEFSMLYSQKLKKIKNLSNNLKIIKNQNKYEKIQAQEEIENFQDFMVNKVNELLRCHAKPLALKVAQVKSNLASSKKLIIDSFQSEIKSKIESDLKEVLNHQEIL